MRMTVLGGAQVEAARAKGKGAAGQGVDPGLSPSSNRPAAEREVVVTTAAQPVAAVPMPGFGVTAPSAPTGVPSPSWI